MSFFKELKRRNVVKVASVYLVTAWLVMQIISVISPFLKLPTMFGTIVTVVFMIGFPIACIFAWAFELTHEGIRPTNDVEQGTSITYQTGRKINLWLVSVVVVLLVYLAVDKLWLSSPPTPAVQEAELVITQNQTKVLAVLPFLNLSNEPEQDIFVDGLTEELLNTLVRIRDLKVLGRTTSFSYKNVQKDLTLIAAELKADYLIEGSVRKSHNNLRITVQLIDAKSGAHLFSDTFDRRLEDVFVLQEEVSNQVASALKLKLIHQDDRYAAALDKLDYKAVEQLVIARALANRQTTADINQAKLILNTLLEQYPDTSAILGLAAYVGAVDVSNTENDDVTDVQIIGFAEQALALDPLNRDAILSLAVSYDDYAQLTDKAVQLYQKAIRAYPFDYDFQFHYFNTLASRFAPCEDIEKFVDNIAPAALELVYKNRLQYFVLACLSPADAQDFKQNATTEDVSRYVSYINPELGLLTAQRHYQDNPNQRNTHNYFYYLNKLGLDQSAQTLLDNIDMTSNGYWATYSYTAAYFNGYPLPNKSFDELWNALVPNQYFNIFSEDAMVLIDIARKSEQLGELRKRVKQLSPPTPSIEQLNATASYISVLRKLGDTNQAKKLAGQMLQLLEQYKLDHRASYDFYLNMPAYEFILSLYAGQFEQAQSLLPQLPEGSGIGLWGLEEVRYEFNDISDKPAIQALLSKIDSERMRLRKKYEFE
ncbi:tetratricopeptide repeat protein [uncultured Paraglaciecola sp.]|uniref:tetratricopeptide repeat protein n=1 Tax=uncultured Paraglaciecola sp. TaxID=1765024 RepID=UPI00259423C0|nr:tetratricopeptide repeat protein [uncultured Paraglaciecola sp.]